jgi:hypothetical protein
MKIKVYMTFLMFPLFQLYKISKTNTPSLAVNVEVWAVPTLFMFFRQENTGLPKLFTACTFSPAELWAELWTLQKDTEKKERINFTYQDCQNVEEYFECCSNLKFLLHYQVLLLGVQQTRKGNIKSTDWHSSFLYHDLNL